MRRWIIRCAPWYLMAGLNAGMAAGIALRCLLRPWAPVSFVDFLDLALGSIVAVLAWKAGRRAEFR